MMISGMKLFHGTDQKFDNIDLKYAKDLKDFGKGFYLTSNFEQAQQWARRKRNEFAYIYEYMVCDIDMSSLKILKLLVYDKKWLDFITQNRILGEESDYDLVYDRIADNQYDEISYTLLQYHTEDISPEKAIQNIKWKSDVGDQYCFKTLKALELIKRCYTYTQYKDSNGKWMVMKE